VVVGNLGNYGRIVWLICLYLCAVSGGKAVNRGRYLLGRTNNVGDPRSRTREQATAGTTSLSTCTPKVASLTHKPQLLLPIVSA